MKASTIRIIPFVCALGFASSVTSLAAARTCTTRDRDFGVANPDGILFSCRHGSGTVSKVSVFVSVVNGVKKLNVNYQQGPAGLSAQIIGLNSSGQAIAGCTLTDSIPADGIPTTGTCNSAVRWRGKLTFNE